MFENKFNTKKTDSLVEAVKQAQADGELRRQAEALVNEEFGVYSRKAVIRENLAAYDARLEEAYKCMKEGNRDNKEKKKEHEEKTGMEHIKKMGGFPGQSPKRTARELTKEEKADKDYDKDGKVESPKDEVWGSRLRAAKLAGKLKEGMADPKDPSYQGGGDVTSTPAKHVKPTNPERIKSFKDPRDSSVQGGGDVTVGGKPASIREALREMVARKKDIAKGGVTAPQEFKQERFANKGAVTKAPVPGVSIAEEEQVDEAAYSAKAARAGKDIGKSGKQFSKIAKKAGEKYGSEERGKKVAGAILAKIRAKHMKEDSSFNAAQETGKSVDEAVATAVPPTYQPASTEIARPARASGPQRLQGTRFYRGMSAKTSGTSTAKFGAQQTARATGPSPKTGTSLVPSGGNRLPAVSGSSTTKLPATTGSGAGAADTGASKLPALRGGNSVTATKAADAGRSGAFTYSRLGDTAITKAAGRSALGTVAKVAAKAAGPASAIADIVTPSGKTEPGNPVFRKTDAGKGEVAGYRSATTPRKTDDNTQKGMVGDMSRRGKLAPSVRNQELPSKIAPVKTTEPGTLSAPAAKPATTSTPAPKSFGQAFSTARKEAETSGNKSTGQFSFKGKQFQTNINPAKGAEKYVPASQQKVTSVGKTPAPAATPSPTTPGSTSISKQPAPPASSTTGISSTAAKVGIPQTPTGMSKDFAMGKDLSNPPSVSSTPAAPKPSAPPPAMSMTDPKAKALKEEVQVGEYKYRIV
jgi:hypothetical protein